jgi:hypothetical protein
MTPFETFVQEVYAMSKRFAATQLPPEPRRRGRNPALSRAAVLTLALLSQLQRFSSERDFMRYARIWLRPLFPTLPDRSQVNRAIRQQQSALEAFGQWCVDLLTAGERPAELLDSTAKPLRNPQRRGAGALPELTMVGKSLRLGFFHGVRLLLATTPDGAITGTSIAPGNLNDHPHADIFFALRAEAEPPVAVGTATSGTYLADTGFAGRRWRCRWAADYGATVIAPPQPDSADAWSAERKQTHTGRRQHIETVFGRLLYEFRLERDRPRTIRGLLSRLAAKVSLHNFLIWANRQHGRPDFAIAEVIGW